MTFFGFSLNCVGSPSLAGWQATQRAVGGRGGKSGEGLRGGQIDTCLATGSGKYLAVVGRFRTELNGNIWSIQADCPHLSMSDRSGKGFL